MSETPQAVPTVDLDIEPISIEQEMQKSYLDYAMSVIVSRALPDVRDGMKPVHRRILYAMKENGYDSSKPFRKSARIVGDVMGKYHPHGDSAIYDSMVRMAQNFSLRLPLVDGQGNFGSMDEDSAAAMRYTEARMAKVSETLMDDIDKDTVDFIPNYDESLLEPGVLPARFPNLLVNGAGGIAVGMATNIPPHNLGEVLDACIAYIHNPSITGEELFGIVPGPDFPTGGIIVGSKGRHSASTTGRGSILMRAKTHREEIGQRDAIIVTEIPYQLSKKKLVERIAEVVKEGIVEGIGELRDESDRDGVRVVIELKRDAMYEVVLSNLYRHTPLQTSFGANMLAINRGKPEQMNLRDIVSAFVEFREEVVIRRTSYVLGKARDRAHILAGLLVAISNIDAVIELIRKASDPVIAREQLMTTAWQASDVHDFITLIDDPEHPLNTDGTYNLSDAQSRAILELRLQRLTGMERDKLAGETSELSEKIGEYLNILSSRDVRKELMEQELLEVKEKFADPRRTEIVESEFEHDIEDLIQREDMVVTVTNSGYIKRVPLSTYRAQRRGGKGRTGMQTKDEDFVVKIFAENTHTPLLLFSSRGMCYTLKVYRLPLGTPQSKGKALVNLLPLEPNETITAIMPLPENEDDWGDMFAMFATRNGTVRRNRLSDFTNIRANGKIAMKLDAGDALINVLPCTEDQDVMLATAHSMAIRFPVTAIRIFAGRNSIGVRGVRLGDGDAVQSMTILNHVEASSEDRTDYIGASRAYARIQGSQNPDADDVNKAELLHDPKFAHMQQNEQFILTVSSNGYGQLASSYDYRVTGRGGKGIQNMDMRDTGTIITGSFHITPESDEIILVTDGGQIIRTPTHSIRFTSRNSKGVRLFNVDDKVVSVAHLSDLMDDGDDGDDDMDTGGIASDTAPSESTTQDGV